uniref:UBP48 n=1 Tax=Poeciliopsis prolifica TaxID=188132 RepID=A0A0S7F343_9TELE
MYIAVCSSSDGYWVGKPSLRSWRQLALEQLEEDEEESKHSNGQTNGQGPHINNKFGMEANVGTEDETKTFNEDIVCTHGALSILETERKLVSTEVWTKLREYFPRAPEFTHMQEPCRQCLTLEQEEKDNEAVSKMMALEQKNQLLNLFHEKNRPVLTKWPQVKRRAVDCEAFNFQFF